jgi:hypothetical protein
MTVLNQESGCPEYKPEVAPPEPAHVQELLATVKHWYSSKLTSTIHVLPADN